MDASSTGGRRRNETVKATFSFWGETGWRDISFVSSSDAARPDRHIKLDKEANYRQGKYQANYLFAVADRTAPMVESRDEPANGGKAIRRASTGWASTIPVDKARNRHDLSISVRFGDASGGGIILEFRDAKTQGYPHLRWGWQPPPKLSPGAGKPG